MSSPMRIEFEKENIKITTTIALDDEAFTKNLSTQNGGKIYVPFQSYNSFCYIKFLYEHPDMIA